MFEINSSGGSITIFLCHKVEAAGLFPSRTLPLEDSSGNSHFHFDSRSDIFSSNPSQFYVFGENVNFLEKLLGFFILLISTVTILEVVELWCASNDQ